MDHVSIHIYRLECGPVSGGRVLYRLHAVGLQRKLSHTAMYLVRTVLKFALSASKVTKHSISAVSFWMRGFSILEKEKGFENRVRKCWMQCWLPNDLSREII